MVKHGAFSEGTMCYKKKKGKNVPTLVLLPGEKLCLDHVLNYDRIQCVPKLHYVLQSTMGRYDFLQWVDIVTNSILYSQSLELGSSWHFTHVHCKQNCTTTVYYWLNEHIKELLACCYESSAIFIGSNFKNDSSYIENFPDSINVSDIKFNMN